MRPRVRRASILLGLTQSLSREIESPNQISSVSRGLHLFQLGRQCSWVRFEYDFVNYIGLLQLILVVE